MKKIPLPFFTIAAFPIDFPKDKIIIDERIHEYSFGDFNGKPFSEFLDYEAKKMLTYDIPTPNGESYLDAKKRFGSFVYDTDKKHSDETILVVTHGIGAEVFQAVYEGASMERSKEIIDTLVVENIDVARSVGIGNVKMATLASLRRT